MFYTAYKPFTRFFFGVRKAQRKSLAKRKANKEISRSAERDERHCLSTLQAFEKA